MSIPTFTIYGTEGASRVEWNGRMEWESRREREVVVAEDVRRRDLGVVLGVYIRRCTPFNVFIVLSQNAEK